MFKGRTFRIEHTSKNRYEYIDAYSVIYGTASELLATLSQQQQTAQRTAMELAAAKQRVKQQAVEEGVLGAVPTPEHHVPLPAPVPVPVKEQRVHALPKEATRLQSCQSDAKPHRRRPNSRAYLQSLRAQEQAEKLRRVTP